MKGKILGYDAEAGMVVLRGEDGGRYAFPLTDWRDRRSPRKGDEVDFEADGRRARDVYTTAVGQPLDAASVAPLSIVAGWEPARFFLLRPVLSCAILVLIACFTGAYSIGDMRISLLQAPDLIGQMSVALDSLVAASGQDPAPRLGAGFTRVAFVLLLALYLVPLLAVLTIWRTFLGHRATALAKWTAFTAIVLPIGLPLVILAMVQFWVLPGLPDPGVRLGRSGVTTPLQPFEVLRLYATGTVLLIGAGAALWAAAAGRLTVPLGIKEGAEPEPIRAEKRGRPDLFAPFRRRAPATPKPVAPEPAPAQPAPAALSSTSPAPTSPAPTSQAPAPQSPAPQAPPVRTGSSVTPAASAAPAASDAPATRSPAPARQGDKPRDPQSAPRDLGAREPAQDRVASDLAGPRRQGTGSAVPEKTTPPLPIAPSDPDRRVAASPDPVSAPQPRPSAPAAPASKTAAPSPSAKPTAPDAGAAVEEEEPVLPAFLKVKGSEAARGEPVRTGEVQAKAAKTEIGPDPERADDARAAAPSPDIDLPTRKGSVWPDPDEADPSGSGRAGPN